MAERIVRANGIELCVDDVGDPANPALVLIGGGSAQFLMWPDALCRRLADGGLHVIRYDNRDTGKSTTVDFERDPYTVVDLSADCVGLLDAIGVERAHLVGASMGGVIGQRVAIDHPTRVRSLTCLWSSVTVATVSTSTMGGTDDHGSLPPPTPAAIEMMRTLVEGRPADREAAIGLLMPLWREINGTFPVDERYALERAGREWDRAYRWEARYNHGRAMTIQPSNLGSLDQISSPTLVLHGTADAIFPVPHAEAMAAAIPGARLHLVEGMGHSLPAEVWDEVAQAIVEHAHAADGADVPAAP